MDLLNKKYHTLQLQSLSPTKTTPTSLAGPPLQSSNTSSPILAIAIIGILTTAFLLVSYYIFVIKCCLNRHRIDFLNRFSISRNRTQDDNTGVFSPRILRRGLEESAIQSIPVFKFTKGSENVVGFRERSFSECAVCLNDFQEEERLRAIPHCSHVFHVDCIDVWLQNNVNCPLCRTSISISTTTSQFPFDQILAPSSSPQIPDPNTDIFVTQDEDYVVIELGDPNSVDQALLGVQERSARAVFHFPGKFEPKIVGGKKKAKKLDHVLSMGDECIDMRKKDDQFAVQPIRRSFSMDSASDRQLYLAVQEIVEQSRHVNEVGLASEGCSSRVRRSFFSFGSGRGSRLGVRSIQLDT
ncbi:hypothetical protein CsSME_00033709 [Camellia sinensis var. sinensis]